jgi:hypothetical protein
MDRDTGLVGIGTTNPSFPLEVDGGTGDGVKIKAGNSSNDDSFLVANNANSTLFLVDGGGDVGIGTTNPTTKLQVEGAAVDNISLFYSKNTHSSGGIYYPNALFENTHSNHSYGIVAEFKTNTGAGTDRPNILFSSGHNTKTWAIGQGVYSANENFAIGYRPHHPNTTSGWATARFVIDTSGNVGIGNTSPNTPLDVNGTIRSTYTSTKYVQLESNASGGVLKGVGGNGFLLRSYGDSYFLGADFGIGTSNPSVKLEVNGSSLGTSINNIASQALFRASNANNSQLYIQDYRTSAGTSWTSSGKRLQMKIDSTWMGWMQFNGTGNNGGISWGAGSSTTQANITEKMRLTSAGKLGLGTTPDRFLSVQSTDSVVARFTNPSNQMLVDLEAIANHSVGLRFTEAGTVKMNLTYVPSIGGVQFGTSHVAGSEKMIVKTNGNVIIGTSSITSSGKLHVDGAVSNVSIYASADIAAFSDARVKDNIISISDPVEKIKAIRGVTYQRTDLDSEKRFMGVIAQEVLPHVPEVVHEDEKGMYSVSYQNMVALLIEGMKEQQEQIDELKEQVKKLSK